MNRRGFWRALFFQGIFPNRPAPVVSGPILNTLPFIDTVQVRIGGVIQDAALHPSMAIIPSDGTKLPELACKLPFQWPADAIPGSGLMVTSINGASIVAVDWTQAPK